MGREGVTRSFVLAVAFLTQACVVICNAACEQGCSSFRLSGFMIPLEENTHTIRWWAEKGGITLKGAGIPWAGEKVTSSSGMWHNITITISSKSGYCITAPTLGISSKCGHDKYVEVLADYPTSWILDCNGSACECGKHRLISVRMPVDQPSKISWKPGLATGARIIGPVLWGSVKVDGALRNQWQDLSIQPAKGRSLCLLQSSSLGESFPCGEDSNGSTSIYFQSSNESGWTTSLWNLCSDLPTETPAQTVTADVPKVTTAATLSTEKPTTETPKATVPTEKNITEKPRTKTTTTERAPAESPHRETLSTEKPVLSTSKGKECPRFRASGFMMPLGIGGTNTIKWWRGEGTHLTVRGPGLPWMGETLEDASDLFQEINTTSTHPGFCVSVPSLREGETCGPEEFLEVLSDHPASWDLGCDYTHDGCPTYRLISVRLPLDKPITVFWRPGPSTGARIIGPGLWRSLQVDEASRDLWHDLELRISDNGSSCILTSTSLGKTFACGQEVEKGSSIYIQGSDAKGWAPSDWAFDTDGPKSLADCVDSLNHTSW